MAIVDPHAIPESADACKEYVAAADAAWDAGNPDEAWDLYYAVFQSRLRDHTESTHSAYRLTLIALNRGDHEAAFTFADSAGPEGKDLVKSIQNAAPQTAPPDPARPPATSEEVDSYWALAAKAIGASDWNAAIGWYGIIAESPAADPDQKARCWVAMAQGLHAVGDDDGARQWLAAALPNLNGSPEEMAWARDLQILLGTHGHLHDQAGSPAEQQLADGIEDYQLGDAAGARTKLEAALHLQGATDEVKGKAEFYIGSMEYQAQQYAEARDRLERAASLAPEPEKTWATQLLAEHWQER